MLMPNKSLYSLKTLKLNDNDFCVTETSNKILTFFVYIYAVYT